MNPTLKQLAGEVRDGRDDQVAQPLAARHDLLRQLDLWVARGWLRALDRAFVAFLVELQPQADPRVLLAAALTSHQLGHGHVCLDLEATLGAPDAALSLPPEGDDLEEDRPVGGTSAGGRSAGNNGNEPAAFLAEQAMSRFRAMLFG